MFECEWDGCEFCIVWNCYSFFKFFLMVEDGSVYCVVLIILVGCIDIGEFEDVCV